MGKDYSLEWSDYHLHKDGRWGRDTILRDKLGRPVARVECPNFKTVIEPIVLPEGIVLLEKDLTGRIIR